MAAAAFRESPMTWSVLLPTLFGDRENHPRQAFGQRIDEGNKQRIFLRRSRQDGLGMLLPTRLTVSETDCDTGGRKFQGKPRPF